VVVVVPASLLPTWRREIDRWATVPGEVYAVRGAIDHDALEAARWILMSWDGARRHAATWTRARWPLWILDESILTKSRGSQRFKALKKIRGRVDRFWMLSGNPTSRYADDLWAQLSLLWPKAFPSYWRFAERYCVVEENVWSKSVVGNRRNKDVMADASDLVLVVNQEDVLELPEYLFETVDVELGAVQRREYDRMQKTFIAELEEGEKVIAKNEVARLMKLQQMASYFDGHSAKHDALIELLPGYEGPHLIWTHWREGAVALRQRLADAGHIVAHVSGDTSQKEKDWQLEGFKDGQIDVLVLSIGVGKFGHTFTNAKTVWYVDKTWAADDYFQSLHRVRRIGLEHRPVVVTLRAPGTADVLVEDNLEGKLTGISKITKSRLIELLKGIGR
jgi:SNF2 family DNA or RNA helicase